MLFISQLEGYLKSKVEWYVSSAIEADHGVILDASYYEDAVMEARMRKIKQWLQQLVKREDVVSNCTRLNAHIAKY